MRERHQAPAVRDYRLASLVCLCVLAMSLWQEGFEAWALLPLIPGLLSLLLLSSAGPIFVLVLLGLLYGIGSRLGLGTSESWWNSGLLIAACLGYTACHWRLLSLTKQAVPSDPRWAKAPAHPHLKGRWFQREQASVRSVQQTNAGEWLVLLTQASIFPLLGLGGLLLLATEMSVGTPQGVSRTLWGLLWLAWTVLGLLGGGYALFTLLRWYHLSRAEAELFLQDELWSATRGPQRRIQATIVQQRYHAEKRGERP